MIVILYFMVALIATIIGATAGLGGGIIMKPLFDFIGLHNPTVIGIYSSTAIFVMCVVSIYKQLKKGVVLNIRIVLWISLGSFVGGLLGETLFNYIALGFSDSSMIKVIQSFFLLIILVVIYLYTRNEKNFSSYNVKNSILIVMIGMFLGTISIFLGIGGGPLNILVFTVFFSITFKNAVIYSLATIFFSQLSKLGQIFMLQSYKNVAVDITVIICIAAVMGALIGTKINQTSDDYKITKIYEVTLLLLILLVFFNVIRVFV